MATLDEINKRRRDLGFTDSTPTSYQDRRTKLFADTPTPKQPEPIVEDEPKVESSFKFSDLTQKAEDLVVGVGNLTKGIAKLPSAIFDVERQKVFNIDKADKKIDINMPFKLKLEEDFKNSFASGTLAATSNIERAGALIFDTARLDSWSKRLHEKADKDQELRQALDKSLLKLDDKRKFSDAISDPEFLANGLAQNFPSLLATLGLGTAVSIAGAPAAVVVGSTLGAGFLMEGGNAANDARMAGADEETQKKAMSIVGVANGLLESFLPTKLILKNPAAQELKKTVTARIANKIFGMFLDGVAEGTTESLQELVSNETARVLYDPERPLTQGVPEAFVFGSLSGVGGSGVGNIVNESRAIASETKSLIDKVGGQGGFIRNPLYDEAKKYDSPEQFVKAGIFSEARDSEARNAIRTELSTQTEIKNIAELKPNPSNPPLNESTVNIRVEDIQEGKRPYVLVDEQNQLVDGHHTLEAYKRAGLVGVPVIQQTKLVDIWKEAKAETEIQKVAEEIATQPAPEMVRLEEKRKAVLERSTPVKKAIAINVDKRIPNNEQVTASARAALKDKVRAYIRGNKMGFREGKQVMKNIFTPKVEALKMDIAVGRQLIREQFRTTMSGIQEIKSTIKKYALDQLEKGDMKQVVTMVEKAQTRKSLYKAFAKIDEIAAQRVLNDKVAQITKRAKDAMEAQNIDVTIMKKIKDVISRLNFKKVSDAKRAKLEDMRAFIQREKDAGRTVNIPERDLKMLAELDKTNIKELTLGELQLIEESLDVLINLGKNKLKTRQSIYEFKKEKRTEEVLKVLKPLELRKLIDKDFEDLSFSERMINMYRTAMNYGTRVKYAIRPMDPILDMMGGGMATYDNPFYVIFKRTLDARKGEAQNMADAIIGRVRDIIETNKTTARSLKRIGIHAIREQKNGTEKLLSTGYTQEEIDAVQLTKEEFQVYDAMRKELDALRAPIEDVLVNVYNKELGKVENYFPFTTDFSKLDDVELWKRFAEDAENFTMPSKKVKLSATKERVSDTTQKLKVDAFDVFAKHVRNASYYVTMSEDVKMLTEIANKQEFKQKAGEFGTLQVKQWLDQLARNGGVTGSKRTPFLDFLKTNTGFAMLGFRLSTMAVQFTALADASSMIGGYSFSGFRDWMTDKSYRDFVYNNMPELRARVGDDPAYMNISKVSGIKTLQEAGMYPIKLFDKMVASGVAWGAYKMYLDEKGIEVDMNNPNKDALLFAQRIVRQTQSSADFKDAPSISTRGGLTGNVSTDSIFSQFQSFVFSKWSRIVYDLPMAVKRRDYKAVARQANALILSIIMEEFLRAGVKSLIGAATGEEPEEDEETINDTIVKGTLSSIPYYNAFSGMAFYGSEPLPILNPIRTFGRGTAQVMSEDPNSQKKGMLELAATAGQIFGIAGSLQARDILKDMIDNKLSPKSVKSKPSSPVYKKPTIKKEVKKKTYKRPTIER